MTKTYLEDELVLDEEFDPLEENDEELDFLKQDEMNDDDINDIVDIPLLPNMPEGIVKKGVYDARNYEDPRDALKNLFEKNPSRRPIYLAILEMCKGGKLSSEVTIAIDEHQTHNRSVYAQMTLCRALERASGLILKLEETRTVEQDAEVEFLEISEQSDPVWTSTEAGLSVLAEERQGEALKELLEIYGTYIVIYERVLDFCSKAPRGKKEIDALVDFDPLVQNPRRYSNHFVEQLERTDALIWRDAAWHITELGKQTLEGMKKEH